MSDQVIKKGKKRKPHRHCQVHVWYNCHVLNLLVAAESCRYEFMFVRLTSVWLCSFDTLMADGQRGRPALLALSRARLTSWPHGFRIGLKFFSVIVCNCLHKLTTTSKTPWHNLQMQSMYVAVVCHSFSRNTVCSGGKVSVSRFMHVGLMRQSAALKEKT